MPGQPNLGPSLSGLADVIAWRELPEDVRDSIRELGPLLVEEELTVKAAAERLGITPESYSRKRDAVARAFVEQGLRHADSLEARLRARIEELAVQLGVT